MGWVKFATQMPNDIEICALSDASFRLYVAGICYAQEQLSDGFVPENVVLRLTQSAKPRHLKELCEQRIPGKPALFTKVDSGYLIRNFTRYNKTAEWWRAEREAVAERKRRSRDRRRDATSE